LLLACATLYEAHNQAQPRVRSHGYRSQTLIRAARFKLPPIMNNDHPQPESATPSRILLGGCAGLIAGMLLGAIALLVWGILRGGLLSVGFGLLGFFYLPLIGGVVGGLCGSVLGLLLALVLPVKEG
jgi:hypothetical protein